MPRTVAVMNAPYRPTPGVEARRVIARRSASDLVFALVLALAGLATPVIASNWGARYPAFYVLALVALPTALLAFGRTLHAWFLPHSIELDGRGLRFAWADRVTCLPWMRARDREVAWSELRRVETHTYSVNGWSTTSLVVTTDAGSFSVPDTLFDRPAPAVQREILDHIDLAREPVGDASEFVRACRERFAAPQRSLARPKQVIASATLLVLFAGFFVWLAITVPSLLTAAFAVVSTLLFGWLTVHAALVWRRDRVLELGPEGLTIGARTIPWHTIRTVRRSVTNGATDGLEIVQHDGSRTAIDLDYGRSYDELARAIDPAQMEG